MASLNWLICIDRRAIHGEERMTGSGSLGRSHRVMGCDLHDGSGCPKGNVSATVEQGHMSKWTLCLVWLALRAKTNVKLIYFCALDISLCLCPAMGEIMSNLHLPHTQLNNNRRSSHYQNKKHQQQTPWAHLSAHSTSVPPPCLYYYHNWPRPRFSEVL